MIKITFPDGSVREFAKGTTAFQIAESISPRLAADSLAASVNGATVDMMRPIEEDASVKFYKWEDEEGKHAFWHTSSHLLAEALEALYPGIKFGIGPAIENGFYYDVDSPTPITEADLPKIEQKMQELSRNKEQLIRREVPKAEALKTFIEKGDQYKVELITDLQDGTISFYTNGAFTDLCRGPHIPNTGYIKALKLTSVAGAYWRGNEKNKMLTRIYGISFPKKSMLDEYLVMMEEAKKRDHRKLGRELDLFDIYEEGPGFPFFLPKGMVLRNILEDFWRSEHRKNGYQEIRTPMILNQELCDKVYNLVKDVKIETTEKTRAFMAATFDNADWAIRDPKVLRGTTVTGDNYWKGMHDHANALLMTETYGCPDPYALTEMEDHAMSVVLDRLGMLDRYIIIRDSVNTDVFMNGASPESLWDPNFVDSLASESSVESADIFATAMKNNFTVGHVVIDAILNGEL